MKDYRQLYEAAQKEIEHLKRENSRLKQELQKHQLIEVEPLISKEFTRSHSSKPKTVAPSKGIHQRSSVKEKLAVFRSYFRGREDVYPVRWIGKQGKTGYSPACGNEWTSVCQKPKIRCSECEYQNYLPVTDEVIAQHLDARANRTIGIYPMLPDETCWFLAMDFDKAKWKDDALAVMNVCKEVGVPSALERSRSGNGAHLWIFFKKPVPAWLARKMGTRILSLTLKRRYQLGLDSYDRLFPNQDTMPKGGFGNLIALPLQGKPRKEGNSVFVNENLEAYADQWSFLSNLPKMSEEDIYEFLRKHPGEEANERILDASNKGNDFLPWDNDHLERERLEEPMPTSVQIIRSDRVYISKKRLPLSALSRLMRLASFSNPEFYRAQAMRLSTYGKPRIISCGEDLDHTIALPRGCFEKVVDFFKQYEIELDIVDQRFEGNYIEAECNATLTTLQDTAARGMLSHDYGILSAPTAFGKTIVAASIIAKRKVNTLILVHRRELMDQWKERLQAFLDVPKGSIGIFGGGRDRRTGIIDIAMIQSLNRKGEIKEFIKDYGQIIIDECHHISAFSFEQVIMKAKARYVLGLTATLKRQDGHEPIVMMQLGPVRMTIDAKMMEQSRTFSLTVMPRYTSFRMPQTTGYEIQDVFQALVADEERNTIIFNDLLECLEEGRSPLLLVERTAHVEYFEHRLEKFAKNIIVLRGGMGKRQRAALKEKIASIPDDEERVFIATGKLIGEGFDDARLDTLFLVHPISWTGTLQQYAGRLHRAHISKKEVKIYDYIDLQVPMLMNMYKKRVVGYRKMGYKGAEI